MFALIILASCIPSHHLFEKFKQKHNRRYYNSDEENLRFGIFLDNLEKIKNHNLNNKFKLGINQFSDMTNEEYKTIMLKPIEVPEINSEDIYTSHEGATFTVDWRDKGAVTPVKNQGQCGSCWSFSATGSLEGVTVVSGGKLISLSEQELVDCDGTDSGCNGGLMTNAFDWIIKNGGLCSESDYNYQAYQGSCKKDQCKSVTTCSGYKTIAKGDEKALASACATNGPISIGIDASHYSFQSYSSGVYDEPACSSTNLDHGVLLAGYGTDSGTAFWLVKNSWGSGWGQSGYIWMSKDKNNQCGIATFANYPTGAHNL